MPAPEQRGAHHADLGSPPVVISRSVTVQDDFEPFHDDPRTDLLTASLGFSRDGKTLTATATLRQPTSPSSRNWWYGYGERRPGIDWHLNLHAETIESDFVAHLRGDPDFGEFGAYGVVTRGFIPQATLVCQASASFDGNLYQVQFPSACVGSPRRIRFFVGIMLYNDIGDDVSMNTVQEKDGFAVLSDWLNMPVLAPPG